MVISSYTGRTTRKKLCLGRNFTFQPRGRCSIHPHRTLATTPGLDASGRDFLPLKNRNSAPAHVPELMLTALEQIVIRTKRMESHLASAVHTSSGEDAVSLFRYCRFLREPAKCHRGGSVTPDVLGPISHWTRTLDAPQTDSRHSVCQSSKSSAWRDYCGSSWCCSPRGGLVSYSCSGLWVSVPIQIGGQVYAVCGSVSAVPVWFINILRSQP